MRKIKLKDWIEKSSTTSFEKFPKDRPTPEWKLSDSIRYIIKRDEYLKENGILVEKEERRYKLNI